MLPVDSGRGDTFTMANSAGSRVPREAPAAADEDRFRRGWILDAAVFITGFATYLVLAPPLGRLLNDADNCSPLAFMKNIRAGEVIYRDFIVQFPPGIYYAVCWWMGLFNDNFAAYITLTCLGNALVSFFVFKTTAALYGQLRGLAGFVLSVALHPALYKWYLCVFALGSVYFFVIYVDAIQAGKRARFHLVVSAVLAGIQSYFRIDTAAYCLVAILCGQAILLYNARRGPLFKSPSAVRGTNSWLRLLVRDAGLFSFVFAATLVPFFALGAAYGYLGHLWETLVLLTFAAPGALSLPYPGIGSAVASVEALILWADPTLLYSCLFFIVPVVYGVYFLVSAAKALSGRLTEVRLAGTKQVPVALFGCLLFLQATHRSDYSHLLQAATVFWIIVPAFLPTGLRRLSDRAGVLGLLCLVPIFWSGIWADPGRKEALQHAWHTGIRQKVKEYVVGPESLPSHTVTKLITYIRSETASGSRILITSHSVQIYYFAHRRFAGGLMYFQPWNEQVYRRVLETLKQQDVALVVSRTHNKFDGLDKRSLRAYAPDVYQYIRDHFCCAATIGDYVSLGPCSGGSEQQRSHDCLF